MSEDVSASAAIGEMSPEDTAEGASKVADGEDGEGFESGGGVGIGGEKSAADLGGEDCKNDKVVEFKNASEGGDESGSVERVAHGARGGWKGWARKIDGID